MKAEVGVGWVSSLRAYSGGGGGEDAGRESVGPRERAPPVREEGWKEGAGLGGSKDGG